MVSGHRLRDVHGVCTFVQQDISIRVRVKGVLFSVEVLNCSGKGHTRGRSLGVEW